MVIKFIRIIAVVIAFTGFCFVSGCSSSTWEDAQQANTYEAYQAYITDHPQGDHIKEAQKRADNRYWESIKNDTTAKSFEKYLDEFPNGQFRSEARVKINQSSSVSTKGRVTGSSIIIRSDHTTGSPSAGVVAKKGTVVQILDRYSSGNSNEAILKHNVTITSHNQKITLPQGKAIHILADRSDSVKASFSTSRFGGTEAIINKDDIEAMSGEKWYKIHTTDNITGWIYGKFIEEL